MKTLLKNIILIILIIVVACGIGFLIFRAAKSINYNKESKNPILTLEVEDYGEIQIELLPDYAPNTVATIIKLAQNGYYDGKIFYGTDGKVVAAGMALKTDEAVINESDEVAIEKSIEEGYSEVARSAAEDKLRVSDLDKSVKPYISEDDEEYSYTDKENMGSEDTDYTVSIYGEFASNGYNDNTLRFEKGTVGLYRNSYEGQNLQNESYNSGTSLFFITTENDKKLNGDYAAFGKVIKGLDLIEKMLDLPIDENSDENSTSYTDQKTLTEDREISKFTSDSFPVITKASVETFGVDYGMPKYQAAFDYDRYISDLILQYYRNQ